MIILKNGIYIIFLLFTSVALVLSSCEDKEETQATQTENVAKSEAALKETKEFDEDSSDIIGAEYVSKFHFILISY